MTTYSTDVIKLKKILVERRLDKITDLAEATNIDRTTLGKILSGKIQPSNQVMYKLVHTLEIPSEEAGNIFFSPKLTQ